jgi:hypothetical protein
MVPFLKKNGLRLVIAIASLYLLFFLELGNRNLFQHGMRILSTPEARELGTEIVAKLDSAKTAVSSRIGNRFNSGSQ